MEGRALDRQQHRLSREIAADVHSFRMVRAAGLFRAGRIVRLHRISAASPTDGGRHGSVIACGEKNARLARRMAALTGAGFWGVEDVSKKTTVLRRQLLRKLGTFCSPSSWAAILDYGWSF